MSASRWLGRERIDLEVCDSTNDEAARLAEAGAAHGTIVVARAQRAGRGRQARAWYSPAGENLYLSCVLRPSLEPARVPAITLAAGVAVARAVNSTGVSASLKWPNDVLVGGRKLAGILTEMSTRDDRIQHVILGIGVNIASREFPADLADSATSLALCGASLDGPEGSQEFVTRLLHQLEDWLDRFFAGGVAAIAAPWLDLAGLAGERAPGRARARASGVEGLVSGIDDHGYLILEDDQGRSHIVVAGDVELL